MGKTQNKSWKEPTLERLNELRNKVQEAYKLSTGEGLIITKSKGSSSYLDLRADIYDVAKKYLSEGTLLKFFRDDDNRVYQRITISIIEKYIEEIEKVREEDLKSKIKENADFKKLVKTTTLNNWSASANFSTPQWVNYIKIPIERGLIKRIRCQVITTSEYYRFGFKLFRINGKLFGDGSIQSMDNNFVIHYGKNFLSNELFITTYRNGILQRPDKYTDAKPSNNRVIIELFIDDENILYLLLNGNEVFKFFINKEIREQIYMLAWADGNEFQLRAENIEIEFEI
jgi:hypothetical protein